MSNAERAWFDATCQDNFASGCAYNWGKKAMTPKEMNDYAQRQLAAQMSQPFGFGLYSTFQPVIPEGSTLTGNVISFRNAFPPKKQSKLEAAKEWLKENGGAHPGCLDRFMKSRGMA
jgi:hypothetical protein